MKTRIPPHLLSFRYVGPPAKRRSDVSESGNDDAVRDSRLRGNDNRDSKNDWKYCVMPAFCRRMAGFTLFEMLIAVSIFALMGVIGFSALGQMTRTGQSVADANDRLSDMQFAVVYFNRDWIQVSPRKIRNQFGDEESNIIIADNSITFTRSGWSNLLGNKRSTLQRVQYLVVDEQLVRRHWPRSTRALPSNPSRWYCWMMSNRWKSSCRIRPDGQFATGQWRRAAMMAAPFYSRFASSCLTWVKSGACWRYQRCALANVDKPASPC